MHMKNKVMFMLFFVFFWNKSNSQPNNDSQKIENYKAFSKLYGYVRWFVPSDEGQLIDWEKFAIYGCRMVETAKNDSELISILKTIFKPLAPSLEIYNKSRLQDFQTVIKPNSDLIRKQKRVYWQHTGVSLNETDNELYKSVRKNAPLSRKEFSGLASAYFGIAPELQESIKFRIRCFVKMSPESKGCGHLYIIVHHKESILFSEYMNKQPISSCNWREYTIEGIIDSIADYIDWGVYLKGEGKMNIDDVKFELFSPKTGWSTFYQTGFEHGEEFPTTSKVPSAKYYTIQLDKESALTGQNGLSIRSKSIRSKGRIPLPNILKVPTIPPPADHIEKQIGENIWCTLPLINYSGRKYTIPKIFENFKHTIDTIEKTNWNSHYTQVASVIIAWNVFQHFYPYRNVIKTDWNIELERAIFMCQSGLNQEQFLETLKRMLSKSNDGHVYVFTSDDRFFPPFAWEWIEDSLVIVKVFDESLGIKPGYIVDSINGIVPKEFFEKNKEFISSATERWLQWRLNTETLEGDYKEKLTLWCHTQSNNRVVVICEKMIDEDRYWQLMKNADTIKKLNDTTYYINLDKASMKEINGCMKELCKAKAIICDLRGYPNNNNDLIRHLISIKDTIQWFEIPQLVYPDQQEILYFKPAIAITPLKPRIDAKIVFIIGNGTISWAETQIALVSAYKLATLVGQPTAGTNGDINSFLLMGTYRIQFTGLRVLRKDGHFVHGNGFFPDVYVTKTIKAVIENRDEFLEEALEILK